MLEGIVLGASSTSTSEISAEHLSEISGRVKLEYQEITERLESIERRTVELAMALAHGIEHEDRRERRIQATVKRARKQLAELGVEDAGLEAEFDGLSLLDGDGGEERGMLALPAPMEESPGLAVSSVKGVSPEQLQRARGF